MFNKKSILCIIAGLLWFSLYAYSAQVTSYAKELGASYKMIGMIAGAYGISQTIFRIPIGTVSDILNKRKMFIKFGFIATTISPLIVLLFANEYTLLAARFLAGIGTATWVIITVVFSSYYDDSETVKASGIINSVSKVGQISAVLIGGFIAQRYGIKKIFIVSIIGGIIGFIFCLFMKESVTKKQKSSFKLSELLFIIKDRYILYISILGAINQLINYGTTFGFTPLIASNLGADNFMLSMVLLSCLIPQVLFSILGGTIFTSKFGVRGTLLIGYIISAVVCMLTPFCQNISILYVIQIFNGIGIALTFPLLMGLVIKCVEPGLRNTAMGFFQTMYGVGIIIGPVLLGIISDSYGLVPGYIFIGMLGIVCIGIVFYIDKIQNW